MNLISKLKIDSYSPVKLSHKQKSRSSSMFQFSELVN